MTIFERMTQRVSARRAAMVFGAVAGLVLGLVLLVLVPAIHDFHTTDLVPTYWALLFLAPVLSGAGVFLMGRHGLRWSTAFAAGVVAAYSVRIALDIRRDRTTHNMMPFEVIAICVETLATAGVGALIGWNARRVADKPSEQGAYAPRWKKRTE